MIQHFMWFYTIRKCCLFLSSLILMCCFYFIYFPSVPSCVLRWMLYPNCTLDFVSLMLSLFLFRSSHHCYHLCIFCPNFYFSSLWFLRNKVIPLNSISIHDFLRYPPYLLMSAFIPLLYHFHIKNLHGINGFVKVCIQSDKETVKVTV